MILHITGSVNWNDFEMNPTMKLPLIGFQTVGMLISLWNSASEWNVKTFDIASCYTHGTLLVELTKTTAAGQYSTSCFASKDAKVFS